MMNPIVRFGWFAIAAMAGLMALAWGFIPEAMSGAGASVWVGWLVASFFALGHGLRR